MTQIFSIKSAAMICVATFAMCLAGQDANAQCRGGGYGGGYGGGFSSGFGSPGISIGYSSGYRGGYGRNFGYGGYGNYGGFNRGISVNLYRPSYSRPASFHNTSHFDHHPARLVPHGNHLDYVPAHSSFHRTGHWHH